MRALALLLLTACGTPICAGCADDAGTDDLPDTFQARFVSLIEANTVACGHYIEDRITIANGTMAQSEARAPAPYRIEGGAWLADIVAAGGIVYHWRVEPTTATTAIVSLDFIGVTGPCSATAEYGPA